MENNEVNEVKEEKFDRAEQAVAYKHAKVHNNCAQSVLRAFQIELGKPTEELRALGSGFGNGMGCMEATCGALCGAAIVVGLLNKSEVPTNAITRDMLQQFQEQAGATICGDLKGVKTHEPICSCDDCVRIATRLAEAQLPNL